MQQSNELRIGNFVRNVEGNICPVTELLLNEFGINISVRCNPANARFGGMVEVISAIDLTAEIIRLAGFAEQNIGNPIRKIYSKDGVNLNSYFQLCNHDGTITINDRRMQFLHQLQNLYLLLTGHELAIDISQID